MKKSFIAVLALAGVVVSAQEFKFQNGGFEKTGKTAKATSPYLMRHIKNGLDLGTGPVVELPAVWTCSNGKGVIRLEKVGEDGSNKENVAEGNVALHVKGESFCFYNGVFPNGKYKISFQLKGSGRFMISFYSYGKDPETGKRKHIISKPVGSWMATDEWKTHEITVDVGSWKPGIETSMLAISGRPEKGIPMDFIIDDIKAEPLQ